MKLLIFQFVFAASLVLCKPVWSTTGKDCSSDPLVCDPTEKCNSGACADRTSCDLTADCTDHGSCKPDFSCNCPGYKAIDCSKDVDECKASPPPCHKEAVCANTDGSFTCACKPGFDGDGKTCKVDCSVTGKNCQNGGTCNSKTCSCPPTYTGDLCENDVDECKASPPPCHKEAVCANTDGSFTCACKPGFNGDGKTCKVDCSVTGKNCQNGGTCISKTCSCPPPYTGDMCENEISSSTADPDSKGGARAAEANRLMTTLILAILLMSFM